MGVYDENVPGKFPAMMLSQDGHEVPVKYTLTGNNLTYNADRFVPGISELSLVCLGMFDVSVSHFL